MMQHIWALSQNCSMSMTEVLQLPLSFEKLFYASQAWKMAQDKVKEQNELQTMKFKQINNLIKAVQVLINSRR